MARNQCSWLRSCEDLYMGENTCMGETSEVMIYYLLLLWSVCVEEGLAGMSHFVNLPSLLVLQCCCLLMWGVFLRETFWIVPVKLNIMCVTCTRVAFGIFYCPCLPKMGLGCHTKVCHWSSSGVQRERNQSELIPKGP